MDARGAAGRRPLVASEPLALGAAAVTEMSDGYVAIEIRGQGMAAILAQATSLDWSRPQASAAISFAGVNAYGSRIEGGAAMRVFVETPLAPYLRLWLEAATSSTEGRG